MKILIQTSTHSYKTYHYLAKRIKEKYPESEFAVIGATRFDADFFNNQNDIHYRFYEDDSSDNTHEEIDIEKIRKFERDSKYKSVWRMISYDRRIGRAFLHGDQGFEFDHRSDRGYILRCVNSRIQIIENIFDDFKPDIFIPAMAMANVDVLIYEEMCRKFEVEYAVATTTRIKNYCAFSSNTMLNLDNIDRDVRQLIDINISPSKEAVDLYNHLIDEIENPDYFDHKTANSFDKFQFIGLLNKTLFVVKYLVIEPTWLFLRSLIKCIKNKIKHTDNDGCNSLKISFIYGFLKRLQYIRLSHKNFGVELESSQKYLYYPLHLNPEYSTLVQGGMWQDQLMIIEALAKSIPADWVVYVKEHPATVKFRLRPRQFYPRLKEIPSVEMAPTYADIHKIISNSQMVAVITGTSGWEAILRGKPVISFSDYINIYDALGLSGKCKDINELSRLISDEIGNSDKVSKSDKVNRLKLLLTSILENSFWVTFPQQLFYDEIGTDEEYRVCGRELADGLIKFLPSVFK